MEPEADLLPRKAIYFPAGNLVYRMPIHITSAFQPILLFILLGVKGPKFAVYLGRNTAKKVTQTMIVQ